MRFEAMPECCEHCMTSCYICCCAQLVDATPIIVVLWIIQQTWSHLYEAAELIQACRKCEYPWNYFVSAFVNITVAGADRSRIAPENQERSERSLTKLALRVLGVTWLKCLMWHENIMEYQGTETETQCEMAALYQISLGQFIQVSD